MVSWEEITPWVTHYDPRPIEAGPRHQRMRKVGLPLKANELWPMDTTPPPGTLSIPQAAKTLGLREHQLRRLMPGLISQQKVHEIKQGRISYLPRAEIEPLSDDEAVKAALTRHAVKLQRTKDKLSEADKGELKARIAKVEDERLKALIDELETHKELATTPEEVQVAMEALEEVQNQLQHRQQGGIHP